MALLQIAEPGQSPAPHQRRLAIGIDLGTTNSLVASVRSGIAEVLADESGADILPSVVRYFPGGDVIVGAAAKIAAAEDPANTIASVKRFMGRGLNDIRRDNLRLPYEFIETNTTESQVPRLSAAGAAVTAVEVSAEILKVLRRRAIDALGGEPVGAVITVPAYFDDAQRQATKDAATLAGLNVLRLLNEPTAAAIAYGLDNTDSGVIAVYDLGGGTFDISILSLEQGVFQVLATGGDTALGGDDFDALIVDWILKQADADSNITQDKAAMRRLLDSVVRAKETLTQTDVATLDVDLGQCRWRGTLDRKTFNDLIEPLVKRTLSACRRVLQDAGLQTDAVVEVVMVGGSTRVPLVQDAVSNFFGRRVLTSIDPDRVVALGAAIQADILAGNKRDSDILLLDVIPLSLGIETMGGLVEKIIPRNSTIPVARAQEFTTFKDGQSAMSVHVVQGERELVSDCRSLAKFELHGIPAMAAGAARIRVTFQVDADGLLNVSALELTSGKSAGIQVKPSFGLSDQEITSMLRDSMLHAENDLQQRRIKERQVEANRMLESIDAALRSDGDTLLNADEKQSILQARDALVAARDGNNPDTIKRAIEELENTSAEYVARRMNASVSRLMKGRVIDDYIR